MTEQDTSRPDVETAGAEYASRFAGPVGRFLLDGQESAIRSLLGSESFGWPRALDVGGGHGQLTRLLLDLGCHVCVQGSAADCARRIGPLMSESEGRLQFVVSSLWSLPFPERYFDLVVGIRLLAHVRRWRELLVEMARVCRYQLMIDYPPMWGGNVLAPVLFPVKRRIEGNTRPYFRYTATELIEVLRDTDFQRFAIYKEFVMPMAIHRALKSPAVSDCVESTGRALGLTSLLGGPALLLAERGNELTGGR